MAISRRPYADMAASLKAWRIWNLLAMQDIRQRYRRSTLGPLWITMSTVVAIGALGLVYTRIFKMPTSEYLPFLAVGIVLWTFLSSILVEACSVFIFAESMIKQVNLPFGIHVARMVWRNLIILAHNLIVVALVLAWYGIVPGWGVLMFLPALLVATIASLALGYLLGILSTRYRDLPQVVASLTMVLFYVTPVIWKPSLLKGDDELLLLNPGHHLLEIMRAPLLGDVADPTAWVGSLAFTGAVCAVAFVFLRRYGHRIAFWL